MREYSGGFRRSVSSASQRETNAGGIPKKEPALLLLKTPRTPAMAVSGLAISYHWLTLVRMTIEQRRGLQWLPTELRKISAKPIAKQQ
jgi:hypothetical protein